MKVPMELKPPSLRYIRADLSSESLWNIEPTQFAGQYMAVQPVDALVAVYPRLSNTEALPAISGEMLREPLLIVGHGLDFKGQMAIPGRKKRLGKLLSGSSL